MVDYGSLPGTAARQVRRPRARRLFGDVTNGWLANGGIRPKWTDLETLTPQPAQGAAAGRNITSVRQVVF